MINSISLGTLLDMQNNLGKGQEKGTFINLFGHRTDYFRQKRASIAIMKVKKAMLIIKKGVLKALRSPRARKRWLLETYYRFSLKKKKAHPFSNKFADVKGVQFISYISSVPI